MDNFELTVQNTTPLTKLDDLKFEKHDLGVIIKAEHRIGKSLITVLKCDDGTYAGYMLVEVEAGDRTKDMKRDMTSTHMLTWVELMLERYGKDSMQSF
jgi:hypothetical protein